MFYILVPPLVLLKKNLIIKIKHEYILLINDGNNTWNTLNFSSSLLSTFFILLKNNYFLELVGISGSFFSFLQKYIHVHVHIYIWGLFIPLLQIECCVLHIFVCWNLIPSVVVFGGVAFQRWLGLEGGTPINGVSTPIKETLVNLSYPFSMWDTARRQPAMSQEVSPYQTWICWPLDLGLLSLQNLRSKVLLFLSQTIQTVAFGYSNSNELRHS